MLRSTLLHLRIPFSFFLLPVFLFAWSIQPSAPLENVLLVFTILHVFLYPASNGYNSYFDKDEKSIGGLKHPPKVSIQLYWTSLLFDAAALILGFWISIEFVIMLFIYGLVSKAYSHPAIRLKKMPYTGWLAAGIFQGYFTFMMSYTGIHQIPLADTFLWQIQVPAMLSSLMLFGSYPMTQVYQHEEDLGRGDQTLSIKLGILGTFHFTAIVFTVATAGYVFYYHTFWGMFTSIVYLAALSPVLLYFSFWYLKVRKQRQQANFEHTMTLNFISSLALNLFFLWMIFF